MDAAAAIAKLVAVVAAVDDMKQSAGRTPAGIVIDGEDIAEAVDAHAEGIPEPGRRVGEPRSIGIAAVGVSAFGLAGECFAVFADELVGVAEILAEAKIQIAEEIEGES